MSKASAELTSGNLTSAAISVAHGHKLFYDLTGDFDGATETVVALQRSDFGGGAWRDVLTFTDVASGELTVEHPNKGETLFRWMIVEIEDTTTPDLGANLSDQPTPRKTIIINAANGVLFDDLAAPSDATASLSVSIAATESGSVAIPIPVAPGDIIAGFYPIATLLSDSGSTTLDATLYRQRYGDTADTVAVVDQVDVDADTAIGSANGVSNLYEPVEEGDTWYALVEVAADADGSALVSGVAVTLAQAAEVK